MKKQSVVNTFCYAEAIANKLRDEIKQGYDIVCYGFIPHEDKNERGTHYCQEPCRAISIRKHLSLY